MKLKRRKDVYNKRMTLVKYFTIFCFGIIILRLAYLCTYRNKYYLQELKNKTNDIIEGDSVPRGRIYDRNLNVIVDNKEVKIIYYTKPRNVTVNEEITIARDISNVLELNYNISENDLKRFFVLNNSVLINSRISKKIWNDYKNRLISDEKINSIKLSKVTKKDISIYNDKDKKVIYIYNLMNKGYYYDEKIIKDKNVTDLEYAYISENSYRLKGFNTKLSWERVYLYGDLLKSVLGSISTSTTGLPFELKDYYLEQGYKLNDRVGLNGLEYQYESYLKGIKEKYKIEKDNSLTLIKNGVRGNDLVLTIDINIQKEIENIVKEELLKTRKEINTDYYDHSFVIIEEPTTGEIIAMVGKKIYYDKNKKKYKYEDISTLINQETVTAGSVVKGASMIVGYNTNSIKYGTTIYDTCINIGGNMKKCSWKNLGNVNDLTALKYSSNVYQYKIAMQVARKSMKNGLYNNAFNIYRNIYYQFGLGVKTGIDLQNEIPGYKGQGNNMSQIVDFAIGQYDTYTPIQLSQYITTIANSGTRVSPHILKKIYKGTNAAGLTDIIYDSKTIILNKVQTSASNMKRIREGFKMVMNGGTGVGYIQKKYLPSGKTGTSESFIDINNDGKIDKETITKNFIGYAPTDNPKMTILVSNPNLSSLKRGDYISPVTSRITNGSSNAFFTYFK